MHKIGIKRLLIGYWIISALLIFFYSYLTTVLTQTDFQVLLGQPMFALSFFTGCFSMLQSYFIEHLKGRQQRIYLKVALIQQAISFNLFGFILIILVLKRAQFKDNDLINNLLLYSGLLMLFISILIAILLIF
ncbi:hypothetical protein HOY36_09770 [Enterococcus sp. MMGLQ5-2]|nr:hypothetical protein [Enterococcus sp. MMGLQ5-2]NPD37658.1 hypothetical protein [Enterococcus sp. MMGLQ5-2]